MHETLDNKIESSFRSYLSQNAEKHHSFSFSDLSINKNQGHNVKVVIRKGTQWGTKELDPRFLYCCVMLVFLYLILSVIFLNNSLYLKVTYFEIHGEVK